MIVVVCAHSCYPACTKTPCNIEVIGLRGWWFHTDSRKYMMRRGKLPPARFLPPSDVTSGTRSEAPVEIVTFDKHSENGSSTRYLSGIYPIYATYKTMMAAVV